MGSRRVKPEATTLHISQGDWLRVRKRLTAGERNEAYDRMYARNADGSFVMGPTGRLVTLPRLQQLANMTAYLLDWSFDDLPILGESVDVIEAALGAIDTDSFDEIRDAILAHERDVQAAADALKKTLSAPTGSDPTSGLPSDAAGPSTTCETLM